MSEELPLASPTVSQRRLLEILATRWRRHPANWVAEIMVRPLSDGGMGSLRLQMPGQSKGMQRFGDCVAEYSFEDTDGVEVIASLYLDEDGTPFELDVWKTDFSPLLRTDFGADASGGRE